MNKGQYKEYLNSTKWGMVRKHILDRDGYKCRFCNSGLDLNVHHRSYEYIGREMQNTTDLVTVCRRCHSLLHVIDEPVKPSKPPKAKKKKKVAPAERPKPIHHKWSETQYRLKVKQHDENKTLRDAMSMVVGKSSRFIMDIEKLTLILTFRCGLPAAQSDFLGVDASVGGWKHEVIGLEYDSARYIHCMEMATEREHGQLDLSHQNPKNQ